MLLARGLCGAALMMWRRGNLRRSILFLVTLLFSTDSVRADIWTTLDVPMAASHAYFQGISGSNVAGVYEDASGFHGFLYNTTTQSWTTVDKPGASLTNVEGIDGSNLVGHYQDGSGTHGFLYDGTTWTTIDKPGASFTQVTAIDGGNLAGSYTDASGGHGFIRVVPVPSAVILGSIGLGVAGYRLGRRQG